jgi:hypothetical protein
LLYCFIVVLLKLSEKREDERQETEMLSEVNLALRESKRDPALRDNFQYSQPEADEPLVQIFNLQNFC